MCCSVPGERESKLMADEQVGRLRRHGGDMAGQVDLEKIAEKLEQADAILAFSNGSETGFAAARVLLSVFGVADIPTGGTRALWVQITETMARLGGGAATAHDLHALGLQIRQLRKAVLDLLAVNLFSRVEPPVNH
jgi:hypothetical protein